MNLKTCERKRATLREGAEELVMAETKTETERDGSAVWPPYFVFFLFCFLFFSYANEELFTILNFNIFDE